MNQAIVEDLVTASHILADQGVLDGLASGNALVGETLQQVVYRAIQTELNARRQLQAMMLDGPLIYMARKKPQRRTPAQNPTPFKWVVLGSFGRNEASDDDYPG